MRIFSILFVALLLTFSLPAFAQDAPSAPSELEQLIERLESDVDRAALVADLKVLAKQQDGEDGVEETPETPSSFSDKIGIDRITANILHEYEAFLDRHNMAGSTFGKSVATAVSLLIFGFILLIIRRVIFRFIHWVDRSIDWIDLSAGRVRMYTRIIKNLLSIAVLGIATYTLSVIWDLPFVSFFESDAFTNIIMTIVNIAFVLVIAVFIWEVVIGLIHLIFTRVNLGNRARMQTIESMVRNVVVVAFSILFILVLLSELGINIMPLLAGAGVLGIAIGFGAQTMVKDFITGFIIILEDSMRVGDVATLAGHTGVIEKITLRTVQLRNYAGVVSTIPFSEITTIDNWTKDFSYYEINMGVAYGENTDEVIETMREVDKDMRANDEWNQHLLSDEIEIAGVDSFGDNAVVIKARIKTKPIMQWSVGREYNRRMKMAFDAKGIEIPFPQRVVHMVGGQSEETAAAAGA